MTDVRTLLDADTWNLLTEDVRKQHPDMSPELADRGVGQMVAFLVAGTRRVAPLSPSRLIDEFWHAFILRTEAYAAFCERVAGRFIHHVPEARTGSGDGAANVERQRHTLNAITAAGFVVDPGLWPNAAECSQCHAGCSDSPNSGKGKK